MDLAGAFNNMTFKSIISSCKEHGIDDTTTYWIYKMLKHRVVNSYLEDTKITVYVSKGCPQGGVLPPLLYILVKDSLLTKLNNLGYNSLSFADDLFVLLSGLFVNTLCSLMESAFKIIEEWCSEHEQKANPDKTKLVLFTRKRSIEGFYPPKLLGKEIKLLF